MDFSILERFKFIIIGALIITAAIGLSVLLHTQRQQEIKTTKSLEQELGALTEEKFAVLKKTKEVNAEKEKLDEEIKSYSAKVQALHTDITTTQQLKENLLKDSFDKKRKVSDLKTQLDTAMQKESQKTQALDKAKAEYQSGMDKIAALRKEKQGLEEKVKSALSQDGNKGLELKKIVVKVAPPIEGSVLEINTKYNFVITDLGAGENIKRGDLVGIYNKDNIMIAEAIIENVYEDMSSIILLEDWQDAKIAVGDSVRLITS